MIHAVVFSLLLTALAGAADRDGYESLPLPAPGTKRIFLGFKLTHVEAGSIYQKVGLKEGDLLKSMNGKPVNTPGDLKELPNILDRDKKVELKVQRGNRKVTLRYRLTVVKAPAAKAKTRGAGAKN
ncbi:MAG: PDZ domain-containing protein [Bdellovibrionales bacterium]|nr:PDZ domain-containing protein [Bdellovibrionales bacterium]